MLVKAILHICNQVVTKDLYFDNYPCVLVLHMEPTGGRSAAESAAFATGL